MNNDMTVIVSMLCEKTPKVMNLIQESGNGANLLI